MIARQTDLEEYLIIALIKKLNVIYFALLSILFIFSAMMIYEAEIIDFHSESELDMILKFIVPVLGLSGFIGGKFLYTIMLKQAQLSEGKLKLNQFELANLLQFASIEGPGILAIIAYLLTSNAFYLVIVEILVIVFLFHRPSLSKYYLEMSADI